MEPRLIACGKRCQLVTGSFDGRKDDCGCSSPNYCMLDDEEREALRKEPAVIEWRRLKQIEFEQLETIKP